MQFPPKEVRSTGQVREVPVWESQPDGSRRPGKQQERDAAGLPLWEVEVVVTSEEYGEDVNRTTTVRFGSATRPQVRAWEPIELIGLSAQTKGEKSVRWSAAGIAKTRGDAS